MRDKGGLITRLGVHETEKDNSYANDVYTKNQHIYLNCRDALLAIQYNPVDEFLVPYFLCVLQQYNMCPKYWIPQ